jgi:hypothetical protein
MKNYAVKRTYKMNTSYFPGVATIGERIVYVENHARTRRHGDTETGKRLRALCVFVLKKIITAKDEDKKIPFLCGKRTDTNVNKYKQNENSNNHPLHVVALRAGIMQKSAVD